MADLFKRVGEAGSVSGVVISINSPGGTTTGAEELYRGIRQLADKKPLVAFVDGTAASGGYIAALAADHIVARETSLVGSIGVLFQYPDVSKLLDTVGVQVEEIKSAPAQGGAERRSSRRARKRAPPCRRSSSDTYDWFKGLVAERRKLDEAQLGAVSTGRIFNGRQSVPLQLVDELGGERDAVAWLEREKGVRQGSSGARLEAARREPLRPLDGGRRRCRSARLRRGLAVRLRQAAPPRNSRSLTGFSRSGTLLVEK